MFDKSDLAVISRYPHKLSHYCDKEYATELHSEWIRYIWDADEHRSLQAHRGSYKTTNLLIVGCIWWLLFHPNDRIAIIRKKFDHASEVVEAISKIMKKPKIKVLFTFAHGVEPKALTDRNNRLTFNFKKTDTPEGSIDAYGIHSEMTGKHYDKIMCDDFVTIDDRISKAEREKTKLRINEIITNIIDPGKYCGFIGTPWHKDDAWTRCPKPLKFDCYSTGLLTEEDIQKKRTSKAMTRQMFAANYELKHIAGENQEFQDPHYKRWEFVKTGTFGHLDCKYEGDHTNALTFMRRNKEKRISAIGFCFEENIKLKYDFVVEKYKKYFCGSFFNEENADKGFVADALKKKGVLVKPYHEKMNKHVKIITYLKEHWDEIDWDPDIDPLYINQILDYIEGQEPDDCPDSAASLLRAKFHDSSSSVEDRWAK